MLLHYEVQVHQAVRQYLGDLCFNAWDICLVWSCGCVAEVQENDCTRSSCRAARISCGLGRLNLPSFSDQRSDDVLIAILYFCIEL